MRPYLSTPQHHTMHAAHTRTLHIVHSSRVSPLHSALSVPEQASASAWHQRPHGCFAAPLHRLLSFVLSSHQRRLTFAIRSVGPLRAPQIRLCKLLATLQVLPVLLRVDGIRLLCRAALLFKARAALCLVCQSAATRSCLHFCLIMLCKPDCHKYEFVYGRCRQHFADARRRLHTLSHAQTRTAQPSIIKS